MSYNIFNKNASFQGTAKGESGSVEYLVDTHTDQSIVGAKTFNGPLTSSTGLDFGAGLISGSGKVSASFFYGDGANLTGITADTANTAGGYSYNKYDATTSAAHNPNGVSGFIVASGSDINNPLSASAITSIHLSGAWEDGMVLHIKAPSNASSFNLNINASGSDKIDGEDSIVLESDYAAVTLLRCHSTRWSIV